MLFDSFSDKFREKTEKKEESLSLNDQALKLDKPVDKFASKTEVRTLCYLMVTEKLHNYT